MTRAYFMANTNASDNPDAPALAAITIDGHRITYGSYTADGRVLTTIDYVLRSDAAVFLNRARERGWTVVRR